MLRKWLWSFALGAISFSTAEGVWLSVRSALNDRSAWVLEPDAGMLIAVTLVATTACCLAFTTRPFYPVGFVAAILTCTGLYISIAATMLVVSLSFESSNIWPIVLAIDAFLMTSVVIAGWLIGSLLHYVVATFIPPNTEAK